MEDQTKKTLGWLGILAIALIPVILLFALGPIASDFSYYAGTMQALAEIALFALNFVLSTRLRFLERIFGGLDKVYLVHGVVGGTALILVLSHPVFLTLRYFPSQIALAAKTTFLSPHIAVYFGLAAIIGFAGLIFITLFSKIKYHKWKYTHQFLALVFAFAVTHALLVKGSVSTDYIFNGYYFYIGIIGAIGVGAFLYTFFIKEKMIKDAPYKILRVVPKKETWEIELAPEKEPLKYESGQFIFVRFYNDKIPEESHPFSIASETGSGNIKIIVKSLGDFTQKLIHLKPGDKVLVEGPYGKFHFKNKKMKDQVWLAGGIGITPFLGMAKDLKNSDEFNAHLIHSVKNDDEFVESDALLLLSENLKNFRYTQWDTAKRNFINADEVEKISGELKEKDFFLCGPEAFKDALTKQLISKGVKKENIHEEAFNLR
jgi:predicted ferric reductase